ncbi:caspase family protein [Bradyrhizobium prioriisuperbiae]|uniref:caspase family protein n=1 Tax=Bradyrhizobium prioriisuperbiae TaxID=2854389 RepID=UPI0028EFB642|nr:caspase family protein [Bradyrhizobium prioritasuperba]
MRFSVPALAVVFQLIVNTCAGAADNRAALVIGNSSYKNAPGLATPANDAEDVAAALTGLGFDVILRRDGSADDLRAALGEFSDKAAKADIALVYFAGYSVNPGVDGYLIPVDARLATSSSYSTEAVPLRAVWSGVAKARKLGLVVLDALRGHPFAKLERQDRADPAGASGSSETFRNVLVFFAAEPGKISEDKISEDRTSGDGAARNSPFAAAILKYLAEPDLEINFLFRKVRDDVRSSTQQKQTPYMYGQLSRDKVFLNAVKQAYLSDPSVAQPCDELTAAPDGPTRVAEARSIAIVKVETVVDAITACTDAVRRFPAVDRFHYQLGRAQFAKRDYASALASYKKAFELGNTRALYALGTMYDDGTGVGWDPSLARFYYEIAAKINFAPAIVRLGLQNERGAGGPKDLAKAHALFRQAADLSDPGAINKLGEFAEKGWTGARNLKQARAFYEKSAAMGDPAGMVNLARCQANGIGGRKDVPGAKLLLAKAAEAGSLEASDILSHVQRPKRR